MQEGLVMGVGNEESLLLSKCSLSSVFETHGLDSAINSAAESVQLG